MSKTRKGNDMSKLDDYQQEIALHYPKQNITNGKQEIKTSQNKIDQILDFQNQLGVHMERVHRRKKPMKASKDNENKVQKVRGKIKESSKCSTPEISSNMTIGELIAAIFDKILNLEFIQQADSKQAQVKINNYLFQLSNFGPVDQLIMACDVLVYLVNDTQYVPQWYYNSFCNISHLIYVKNLDPETSQKIECLLFSHQLQSVFELKAQISIKLYNSLKGCTNYYSNVFYVAMDQPPILNSLYRCFKSHNDALLNQIMQYLANYPSFCNKYIDTIISSNENINQNINLFALHFIKYLDATLILEQILDKYSREIVNYDILLLILLNFSQNQQIHKKLDALLLSQQIEDNTQNIAQIITIGYFNMFQITQEQKQKMLMSIAILLEFQKLEQIFTDKQFAQLIKIYVEIRQLMG